MNRQEQKTSTHRAEVARGEWAAALVFLPLVSAQAEIRQALVDALDSTEQSELSPRIEAAIAAFDRKPEEDKGREVVGFSAEQQLDLCVCGWNRTRHVNGTGPLIGFLGARSVPRCNSFRLAQHGDAGEPEIREPEVRP
jgi:hypothetical protein